MFNSFKKRFSKQRYFLNAEFIKAEVLYSKLATQKGEKTCERINSNVEYVFTFLGNNFPIIV